jgi:hypothetical protein
MIVPYGACLVYIASLLLAGYAVIGWTVKGSKLEMFGFSACLGPGIFGLILIAISMLGFQPNAWIVGFLTLIASIASVLAFLKQRRHNNSSKQFDRVSKFWLVIGLIALSYGLIVVFWDSAMLPPAEWDAFAIWQFKSKILLDHALLPKPAYFLDPTLSYSHQRYPILWPMICTGLRTWIGAGHDELAKSSSLLFFVGLSALVFSTIRRLRGTESAIGTTLLLQTLPAMLQFSGTGIADLPLTAFYAGSIICILRWQQEQKLPDLILAAIFSACMMWTKNEGIALAVINALALMLFAANPISKRNLLSVAVFVLTAFLLFLPWMLYVIGIPKTDEDYAGRLSSNLIFQRLSELASILGMTLREFASPGDWGFFWYALLALSICRFRTLSQRPILMLWFLFLTQMAVYTAAFLVTNWDVNVLIPTTLHRLILHTTPAAALIFGLQWPVKNQKSESN